MPDKYDKMLEDYFTVTEKDFKVKLVKLNWDEECRRDFLFDKGFEIKEPGFKGKEEKSLYGIHSPLFATDYGDDDAFADRYSCKCRETIGRLYDGEICPICKTKVVFRDVDLKITGWIILKKYKVIQPIFYKMIRSIIGEKMFTEMIEFDKEITRDGILLDKKSKNPFKGIGMLEFQERFEEIMEYFKKKKKDKLELITDVLKEKEKVFTSCIPVYSSVLRPVAFKGESFSYTPIDKKYNVIFSLVRSINEGATSVVQSKRKRKKMDNPTKIYSLQKKIMDLWTLVFNEINQKDGHIRENILGGRIDFSARNVIIPDPDLRVDEVKLGYLTFLELYKYEIIAHISQMSDISENEAYDQWFRATISFNRKIYEIMKYLIKKRKPHVIINRNPTINYGSMLLMKVVDIKDEYKDDYTMSLPIQILNVLNADL